MMNRNKYDLCRSQLNEGINWSAVMILFMIRAHTWTET